jgi:phenylacetate-CoA ligase
MADGTEPSSSSLDPAVELSVIVPCLNEELNVPELTGRILRVFELGGIQGELVLVDDGSTDGTATEIRRLMAEHPGVVQGCFHPHNRGIAAGWRSGAAAARGKLAAIIDADLQYQPEDILRLRRELYEHSVDIVQGWRSAVGRDKEQRYYLSRGFNTLLNGVFGMHLQDNKSGFLVCAREVLLDLLTYEGSFFYWQSFVMVAAHAKGYSYKEVETLFERRRQGTSFLEKTAIQAAIKSFYDLGKAAWEYRVTRPPPDVANQFLRRNPVTDRSPERDPLTTLRFRTYLAAFNRTHGMITRDVEHYHETRCRSQWLSPAQTRELQDEKLRRLVRHAYRNVPFYRSEMQARKIRPEDIRGQADLDKLPLLTKDDLRRHVYFDLMSENHDKAQVLRVATSGSSGEPLVCYADRAQLEMRWAAALRAAEWTGYRFGDPSVLLWDEPAVHDGRSRANSRHAAQARADALLANRTVVPVFEMAGDKLPEIVETLQRVSPKLIDGPAEALDFLARYVKSTGASIPRPKAILSSAQTLTPASRKRIEEAFGCKVYDAYTSGEFSGIAYECEAHQGHHVVAEDYVVEVLDGSGKRAQPGQMGEVVVTDLNNFCMPFIRYRIGDLAEVLEGPCSCGRGAPRLGTLEGRAQSIFQGTDGRCVPGTFFAHYLKDFDHAIRQFQVVQEEPGAIQFRVVRGGRFSQEALDEAVATFRQYLGQQMRIDVELVDAISPQRRASVSGLGVEILHGAHAAS